MNKGIELYCPHCKGFGQVYVNLAIVSDMKCIECEEEITTDDIQAVIDGAKSWERVLKWLDTIPTESAE